MFIMPADSTLKSHLLALLEVSVKCMFTRLINHVENSTWNLHLKSTWILKDRCGFSAQIFYKTAQWSLVQMLIFRGKIQHGFCNKIHAKKGRHVISNLRRKIPRHLHRHEDFLFKLMGHGF